MKVRTQTILSLLLAAVVATSIAKATNLPPGTGPSSPDALTVGSFPSGTVSLVASISGGSFSGSSSGSTLSGNYDAVVLADQNNVFCAGCYDFEIDVYNVTGNDDIGRITATNFTGFSVDAGYDTLFQTGGIYNGNSGTPSLPSSVDRLTADVVGFDFANGIAPGNSSVILEIETNATSYTTGSFGFLDGFAVNAPGFEPSAVPEPATLSLLGTGLVAMGGLLRRKRNS